MQRELQIGDKVELTFKMQSLSSGGTWPAGSKGVVEKIEGGDVTVRMYGPEENHNAAWVGPMETMLGAFRSSLTSTDVLSRASDPSSSTIRITGSLLGKLRAPAGCSACGMFLFRS
jgi:hypothetical protein